MDIIDEILKNIKHSEIQELQSNEYPEVSSSNCKPIYLTSDHFHQLPGKPCDQDLPQTKLCFIDGGNNEIFSAPHFSLQWIKVAAIMVKQNKRIKTITKQYYLLAKTNSVNNQIYFTAHFFPFDDNSKTIIPDNKTLQFHSFDKTITQGTQAGSITTIGEIARKFSELLLAQECVSLLNEGDAIILDNHLKTVYTFEEQYFEQLYACGLQKKVIVCGLCKTTTMMTNKGRSVVSLLSRLSSLLSFQQWYYYPVAEINDPEYQAELYFVKLHKASNYIFRFEVYTKQHDRKKVEEILALLAQNSKDYSFPGYPFGLIQADQEARVSNADKEYIKMKFLVNAKKDAVLIEQSLRANNAHSILDSFN